MYTRECLHVCLHQQQQQQQQQQQRVMALVTNRPRLRSSRAVVDSDVYYSV